MSEKYVSHDGVVAVDYDETKRTGSVALDDVEGVVNDKIEWSANTWDGIMRPPAAIRPISRFSIMGFIRLRIDGVIGNGNESRMSQVHVSKMGAISLLFNGTLSVADLRRAKVTDMHIVISDVTLLGRKITVVIHRESRPYGFVHIADHNGVYW